MAKALLTVSKQRNHFISIVRLISNKKILFHNHSFSMAVAISLKMPQTHSEFILSYFVQFAVNALQMPFVKDFCEIHERQRV